jgi:hypothetical protein
MDVHIPDTGTGIARPGIDRKFRHCVAGMHIGGMTTLPHLGEFDAVLSVGADEGIVENGVRHKHLHLHYGPDIASAVLDEAAAWVGVQVSLDRKVLVRSEGGRQRPGLVVAAVVLHMGGFYNDAINSVRRARLDALTDFRYLAILKHMDQELNPHAATKTL